MRNRFLAFIALSVITMAGEASHAVRRLSSVMPVFEENKGQAAPSVLFLARDARGTLAVTRNGAEVTLFKQDRRNGPTAETIDLRFPGANFTRVKGASKLLSHTNLLLGNNPAKWGQKSSHY